MLDDSSQRTIEHCLIAAESAMSRAGIETIAQTAMEKPHGFTNLAHFDNNYHVTRIYRPAHGAAPFRNFLRSFPNTESGRQQISELLTHLKRLEKFFRPFLVDPNIEIPEISDAYIKKLVFHNLDAWPDDLYYGLTFKPDELFRSSTRHSPTQVADLSEIAPRSWETVPDELRHEHSIKNAIDLVCMGPWAGIPVPKIIQALKDLEYNLREDPANVRPPILQCLEPETTWRLTIPLWRAGRFHGEFSVVLGGSVQQLESLKSLVSECNSISHLLFSVLQRERERRARRGLRTALSEQEQPLAEAIRDAVHILAAPHYVREVTVANGPQENDENNASHEPLRFTVQEELFGQPLKINFELFDEKRPIIRELMKIYIAGELRAIRADLSTARAGSARSGEAGNNGLDRAAVEKRARTFLQKYESEPALEKHKYCLCFIALAIVKRPSEEVIKISGITKYHYQDELASEYNISRKRKSSRDPGNNTNEDPATAHRLPLSQLCDARAVTYVEEQMPGIFLKRDQDVVEIHFGKRPDKNVSED